MSQIKRYIPVFTALLSILILLGLQVYWLMYSYKIEEALFNKSVKIALNQSIATLSKDEGMCQSMQKSISCDSSFRASRNKTPHVWKNLDSQIREELAQYDIDLAYELAIFKGKDTLKINNLDQLVGTSCYRLNLENILKMSDTEIGVVFPNRYNFFLHRMGLMFLGSVLLILMIGFSFVLLIRYYIQEIRLSKNIKEMVNNLAHEFRTPISSISLAAKMIHQSEEVTANQKLKRYTETIIEENKRLQRQSDHILQLAAIEQNNLEYHFGDVELTGILDEAIRSVDFLVEQKGGKITRDFGDVPIPIHGDHNELVHVMMNLLVNAYKYSHQKIDITVTAVKRADGILVEVIDKGIGISPKEKKKIFEKYYRISTGNKHNTKGFGIGLYYVKEVLKAHHASIHVESEPGKGSKFSIVFHNIRRG
jgi:two-component system, OmpR family, phosphate regulon sensor histidine kinase PhoR